MRAEWYTEPYTNDSGKVQFNAKIRDSVTVIRVYYDKNGVLIHQNSLFNRSINGTEITAKRLFSEKPYRRI